jgi:glycosyl transferase, family 25
MNLSNIHIITIDHNDEFYKSSIQKLIDFNFLNSTLVSFGGEKGSDLFFQPDSPYKFYSKWNLFNSGNSFWDRDMTLGEFGCVVSHIKCWEHYSDKDISSLLILEQDFNPLFNINWGIFTEVENYDWDIILLGRRPLDNDIEIGLNYFIQPGYSYQAHAYMVSKQGLEKICKELITLKNNLIPTDEFLPALYSAHPRQDIEVMYPNKINALALRLDVISQNDWEGTGRSRTAP